MPWRLEEYEEFIYRIRELSPHIIHSTLVSKRRGRRAAFRSGEIRFANGITLEVFENLQFLSAGTEFVRDYGYTIRKDDTKAYWYDSQPHPNDPSLQSTHPHHKHIPPDIKHHRIPAPGLAFNQPNLPFLIREIEKTYFN